MGVLTNDPRVEGETGVVAVAATAAVFQTGVRVSICVGHSVNPPSVFEQADSDFRPGGGINIRGEIDICGDIAPEDPNQRDTTSQREYSQFDETFHPGADKPQPKTELIGNCISMERQIGRSGHMNPRCDLLPN